MSIPLTSLQFPASYIQIGERLIRILNQGFKQYSLESYRLERDTQNDLNAHFDGHQMCKLLTLMNDFIKKQENGCALLFNSFPLTMHRNLGLAVMTAPTFRKSVEIVERHMHQVMPAYLLSVENRGNNCVLSFTRLSDLKDNNNLLTEIVIGIFIKILESVNFSRDDHMLLAKCIKLSFQHKALELTSPWSAIPIDVQLGAEENSISLPIELMDREIITANPSIMKGIEQNLNENLIKRSRENTMAYRVSEAINRALINDGFLDMADIAETLSVTSRTLSRRLKEEDTSFQTLLGQCRMDRAGELLTNSTLTIGKIAFSLGFNNEANFSRAFKKFHNMSPTQYRNK